MSERKSMLKLSMLTVLQLRLHTCMVLLRYGANVSAVTRDGDTVLHHLHRYLTALVLGYPCGFLLLA
jgi:hypothetical protein